MNTLPHLASTIFTVLLGSQLLMPQIGQAHSLSSLEDSSVENTSLTQLMKQSFTEQSFTEPGQGGEGGNNSGNGGGR